MNKVITKTVTIRGQEKSIDQLKENSNKKVTVECKHGQREVRWCRRHQQCRKCVAEAGLYNTSKVGRKITWGDKISKAKKGVKLSELHKKELSIAQYECSKDDWPGFYKKSDVQRLRDSVEYLEFRKYIFKRDGYKCQITGLDGKLEMHHVESMNHNLSKALDPSNVITLHKSVHKEFHDLHGRGNNTREQFDEFVSHKSSIIGKEEDCNE